ncbi:MAG: NCS2 family permease [Firmicutes bacterium]|nr:NCS2 family permease [Bacillota bacterium]MBR3260837.1 NCS2 family permease [Bacillota bacterium]MBR3374792.1 NCS2 family permease [Bacillota bacterium]MBR4024050.1 NCS2 family permease [Bacillota bacterium]MBR6225416.1 NCS2 family permease [Bacillota bacterium]
MDKFFEISKRGSTVRTEIFAGLTTFFAMAYIIIVNPNQITGFSEGLGHIWNAVYVGSILVAVAGTLIMGLYAKMPFAQACGMGLNSFFFVSFILPELMNGGDPVEGYHAGLVIVFVSGLVFLVLSITGARQYIAKAMPPALKVSVSAGIGLFIAYIGFQNVGFIQDNQYTLTQLVDIHGAIANGELLNVVPAILGFIGFLIIVILGKRGVRGNVIIGIFSTALLYYVIVREAPQFDYSQVGQSFRDFIDVGVFGVFTAGSWHAAFSPELVGGMLGGIMLVVAFCLVDMFDTIGTLYGTASEADMLDENGDPINLDKCMMADSTATVLGAMLGTSTCTTFVESATGVSAGGRTGLTSVTVAICFFLCLFLTPLASVVPACATAPALVYVGVLMLGNIKKIDMTDLTSAAVGFMTVISMLLTYSIANGIGIGAITYTVITIFTGKYSGKDIMVTIIALLFVLKFCMITM